MTPIGPATSGVGRSVIIGYRPCAELGEARAEDLRRTAASGAGPNELSERLAVLAVLVAPWRPAS